MEFREEIHALLKNRKTGKEASSRLGFFSQPLRFQKPGFPDKVIKFYHPVKDEKLVDFVCENHDSYVKKLSETGIHIPKTSIYKISDEGKFLPVIVQDAFTENELVRGRMEGCPEPEFRELLRRLLEEIFCFIRAKNSIGFHPTLRNFAVQEKMWYFDTFPPMDMDQQRLNSLILAFAPLRIPISGWVPLRWVNRVSNEYYSQELMLKGIVGSACRLRPEFAVDTLVFARERIKNSGLKQPLILTTLAMMEKPPKLNQLWVTVRGFLGKEGKPNL